MEEMALTCFALERYRIPDENQAKLDRLRPSDAPRFWWLAKGQASLLDHSDFQRDDGGKGRDIGSFMHEGRQRLWGPAPRWRRCDTASTASRLHTIRSRYPSSAGRKPMAGAHQGKMVVPSTSSTHMWRTASTVALHIAIVRKNSTGRWRIVQKNRRSTFRGSHSGILAHFRPSARRRRVLLQNSKHTSGFHEGRHLRRQAEGAGG